MSDIADILNDLEILGAKIREAMDSVNATDHELLEDALEEVKFSWKSLSSTMYLSGWTR